MDVTKNLLDDNLLYPKLETIYTDGSGREMWEPVGKKMETDYASISDVISINAGFVSDKIYILKYLPYSITTREMILNQINLQVKSAELGVSPKVIDAWFSSTGGMFVMEKLNIDVGTLLVESKSLAVKHLILASILSLLGKLHLHNIYHGDVHFGNIMAISEDECPTYKPDPTMKSLETNGGEESLAYAIKRYRFYLIDFGEGGYISEGKHILDGGVSISDCSKGKPVPPRTVSTVNPTRIIRLDYNHLGDSLYDLLGDFYTPALRSVYDTFVIFLTKFD